MLCLPRPPSVVGQVIPQEEIQNQKIYSRLSSLHVQGKKIQICLYWGHSFKLYQ